jgi:hypothetical protein
LVHVERLPPTNGTMLRCHRSRTQGGNTLLSPTLLSFSTLCPIPKRTWTTNLMLALCAEVRPPYALPCRNHRVAVNSSHIHHKSEAQRTTSLYSGLTNSYIFFHIMGIGHHPAILNVAGKGVEARRLRPPGVLGHPLSSRQSLNIKTRICREFSKK